jgi:hypothetical protein
MKQTDIGVGIKEPTRSRRLKYLTRPSPQRRKLKKLSTLAGAVLHSIFISYRRDDSEGEAGRLSDDLEEIFAEHSIFMDVNAIQPGRDFRKAIDESIHKCSVLLAILGPSWLSSKDASGQRRLDDDSDFLRLELVSALKREIPVIPVLIRGTKMPRPEQLPDDLKELAFRNAVELTHARWKSDLQVLVRALRPYLQDPAECAPATGTDQTAGRLGAALLTPQAVRETTASGIEKPVLDRITHELAAFIGPIAEVVVKRAAKRSLSMAELCEQVSQEIPSSKDRSNFLASCRR